MSRSASCRGRGLPGLRPRWSATLVVALVVALAAAAAATPSEGATYRIDHVTDGDTVVLRNGQKVRLVQVDTPEVYFGTECYGPQASAATKRLLPVGARVRLTVEPATDRIDAYGRLLRYVVRASDGVNVNLRLVAVGAAAPYFYYGRRGRYAERLEALAMRAKAKRLGLRVHVRTRSTTRTTASGRAGKRPDRLSQRLR